jgi:PAS domain-containing protein
MSRNCLAPTTPPIRIENFAAQTGVASCIDLFPMQLLRATDAPAPRRDRSREIFRDRNRCRGKKSSTRQVDNQRLKLGVWDWDLGTDLIYADDSVARMFGLDANLTENGLPPEQYFSRIHNDDRQTIVDHAHLCVETLGICLDDFRIVRPSGTIWVHSRGRCFADSERRPTIYAGLIVEIDQQMPRTRPNCSTPSNAALPMIFCICV